MPRNDRPHTFGRWVDRNARYVFVALSAVAAMALASVALNTAQPTATAVSTAPVPAFGVTPDGPERVTVSILSDSHAYNADSWWRQTVNAGTIPGVKVGAFESQPGAATGTLIRRLDAATALGGYVIVQVGTNDLMSAISPGDAITGIEALWSGVAGRGALPIAALVPPSDSHGPGVVALNDAILVAAAKRGIPVLDVYTTVAAADGTWDDQTSGDGIHASAAGSTLMAEAAKAQLPGLL